MIAKQSNGQFFIEQPKEFVEKQIIAKINNCIANSKMFYYGNIIDEYERQREIFILVSKANLVNKSTRR